MLTINYYLEISVEWEFSDYIHTYRKRVQSVDEGQVLSDKYYCSSVNDILDELSMQSQELMDIWCKYEYWPVEIFTIGDIVKITVEKEIIKPCLTTGLRRKRSRK